MHRLSVRSILLGLFGLMAMIIAGQGLFSLSKISSVNDATVDIRTNWMPSVDVLRQMQVFTAQHRALAARHILAGSEKAMLETEKTLDARLASLATTQKRYQTMIATPQERTIFEKYSADWTRYQNSTADLMKLSRSQRNEEAQALFNGQVLDIYNDVMGDVESLVKINTEGADRASASATANFEQSRTLTVTIVAISLLLAIGAGFLVLLHIIRPLSALLEPLNQVSAGNFVVAVPGVHRQDEVGQIAKAVDAMAKQVKQTIGEIKLAATEVNSASSEITTSTTDLSQRTEEQAASLEETTAAMEEISAAVKKSAENAELANRSADQARTVADQGGQVVAKAVDAMAKIEDSSRKISDIIGVIDEIARQTNLLALNAAVEAARAGEAGRGFAVVASEVRSLAQRSSQAAKDIKELITNSNGQVKDGVELVNHAGGSLAKIVDSVKEVAALVNDIAIASTEQATGLEQINKALMQMDEVTQQNAALVEENAATAKALESQAQSMDEQVAFFKIDDEAPVRRPSQTRAAAPAARKPAAPVQVIAKAAPKAARRPAVQGNAALKDDWTDF